MSNPSDSSVPITDNVGVRVRSAKGAAEKSKYMLKSTESDIKERITYGIFLEKRKILWAPTIGKPRVGFILFLKDVIVTPT
jgi:hypothetical protein